MEGNLSNLNDLLAEIEGISLHTTNGAYVKVEDVRRLMEQRQLVNTVESATAFKGKTFTEANRAAKRDLGLGAKTPQAPGRSIPASEPQPPSRA